MLSLLALFVVGQPIGAAPGVVIVGDWREAKLERQACVTVGREDGTLTLWNDLGHLKPFARPSSHETVTSLVAYQGDLYAATCTHPIDQDGGTIWRVDPVTLEVRRLYEVGDQGVFRLRVLDDLLVVPGPDPIGVWDAGNVYVWDGSSIAKRHSVPYAKHVFDVATYHGKWYATTGWVSPDRHAPDARVFASSNHGATWESVYSAGGPPYRLHYLAVFRDKLYALVPPYAPDPAGTPELLEFDGAQWRGVDLTPGRVDAAYLGVVGEGLLLGSYPDPLWWDGKTCRPLHCFGPAYVRDCVRHAGEWVACVNRVSAPPGSIYFEPLEGPEPSRLYATSDGLAWREVGVMEGRTQLACLASCRERLFAGSHGGAVFMVSAAATRGEAETSPICADLPEHAALLWQAAQSATAHASLQLRLARSLEGLAQASYVGPNGEPTGSFVTPGSPLPLDSAGKWWVQAKIRLESDDAIHVPYVGRVEIGTWRDPRSGDR